MNNFLFLFLVIVALALAEAGFYFLRYLAENKDEQLKRRLRSVGEQSDNVTILRSRRLARSPWLNEAMAGFTLLERLERLLDQTDLEMSVAQLIGWSAVLFLGGGIFAIFMQLPFLAPI